ncbi:MAG: hypothetical protein VB997_10735, partial [Opitutales bacterium]
MKKRPLQRVVRTVMLCGLFWANGSLVAKNENLVTDGDKPVKLAGGFKFTEGPAVDAKGNVFFTDIPNNRVHKWDVTAKKLSTFIENSGGANGLFFSKEGDLFACLGEKR